MYKLYEITAIVTMAAVAALFSYIVLGFSTYELNTVLVNGLTYVDLYYTIDDCYADMLRRVPADVWSMREVSCVEVTPWQAVKSWLASPTW